MRRRVAPFHDRRRVNDFDDGLPNWRERRMCFGKRMMNKQQALQTAAYMRKHFGATDALGPFKCSVCKHWHIGNNRRRTS